MLVNEQLTLPTCDDRGMSKRIQSKFQRRSVWINWIIARALILVHVSAMAKLMIHQLPLPHEHSYVIQPCVFAVLASLNDLRERLVLHDAFYGVVVKNKLLNIPTYGYSFPFSHFNSRYFWLQCQWSMWRDVMRTDVIIACLTAGSKKTPMCKWTVSFI